MALLLPDEVRTRPRLVEALVAIGVVVGLCSLGGCATSAPRAAHSRTRRLPARVIAAHVEAAPPGLRPVARHDEGAGFVERSLRDTGLRFGTDGSTRALWEYLRLSHQTVAPTRVRAGDVLFFDTRPTRWAPDCDDDTDHAGIVEEVEPDGRIIFVETRGGQLRRSVVDPVHPTMRRNDRGEIREHLLARQARRRSPRSALLRRRDVVRRIARVDR